MRFELVLDGELLIFDGAVLQYSHRGVNESTRIRVRLLSVLETVAAAKRAAVG
jgi:hypothetical protein